MWILAPTPTSPPPVRRPAAPQRNRCGTNEIDAVIGVAKVYTTRVGSGPFPTELTDAVGDGLQARGKEFGSTTGRARRCGWFDGVLVRYATKVNGLTSLAVTKLDVLDGCKELNVCTGYRYQGKLYRDMPADLYMLMGCQPVYETMRGWTTSTTGATSYATLPREAKQIWSGLKNWPSAAST